MNEHLSDAIAARDAARAKHLAAAAALERARRVHAVADAEAARLAGAEERRVARHAARLQRWISEGGEGPAPALTTEANAQQTLATARAGAAAAGHALAALASAEAAARNAVATADAAARAAALSVLAAEGEALARAILDRDAETEAMRARLRGLRDLLPPSALIRHAAPVEGDWIHTPVSELAAPNARDPMHTPIDRIGRTEVEPAAAERWRARLEDLLSGSGVPEPALEERAA